MHINMFPYKFYSPRAYKPVRRWTAKSVDSNFW